MGFEQHLHLIGQWLVNHGFQLSNREWASLGWLALIVIVIIFAAATSSKVRHDLTGLLKTAFLSSSHTSGSDMLSGYGCSFILLITSDTGDRC